MTSGHICQTLITTNQANPKMAPSRITITERLQAIKMRAMDGDEAVLRKYRISSRTLRRWAENGDIYRGVTVTKAKSMSLHQGRPRQKTREAAHLMAVVENMIANGRGTPPFNSRPSRASTGKHHTKIPSQLIPDIHSGLQMGTQQISTKRYYLLLTLDIVSRAVTNKSIAKAGDEALQTLAFCGGYQTEAQGIEESVIINMDETSLAYDMPSNRAYAKRGSKNIVLRTGGKEKNTVTIALAVSRAGDKLPPFIIFRGNLIITPYY